MPTTPKKKISAAERERREAQIPETSGFRVTPVDSPAQVSTAKGWKKKGEAIELPLPSENVCLVKRPGLAQLLADDILPDLLTPIAQQAIAQGQSGEGVSAEQSRKMMEDLLAKENGLQSMFDAFARVTAHCVVEPKAAYHRREVDGNWEVIPDDERDEDFLYTDTVDLDDQMFIFNYVVGGSKDLVRFREELGAGLGGLGDVQRAQEDAR